MKAQDHILIKNWKIPCRVGCSRAERQRPQSLLISIFLFYPLGKAGRSDQLKDTIDYAFLIHKISRTIKSRSFVLIEGVAETIAKTVLQDKRIRQTTVCVCKKPFKNIEAIEATITRSN